MVLSFINNVKNALGNDFFQGLSILALIVLNIILGVGKQKIADKIAGKDKEIAGLKNKIDELYETAKNTNEIANTNLEITNTAYVNSNLDDKTKRTIAKTYANCPYAITENVNNDITDVAIDEVQAESEASETMSYADLINEKLENK